MPEWMHALEGELLGDGSLLIGKHYTNAMFRLQTKYKGQVYFAFTSLHCLGGTPYHFLRKPGGFNKEPHWMWQFSTHRSQELTELHKRWYVNKIKVVPRDFLLTKEAALHWYVGDGSLQKHNPRIVLCTDNFDELSVAHLMQQLRENGFSPRKRNSSKKNPRIELGVDDVVSWLAWIGPCPVPELQHKWQPNFREKRHMYITDEELEIIRDLHVANVSCGDIARKLGRSYHTIYSVFYKGRARKRS